MNPNWTNITYVGYWGVISFVASFMCVLEGNWNSLLTCDLLKGLLCPIFIWISAFFADYIYTIQTMNKETHILNTFWTKASYVIVEIVFVFVIISAYWTSNFGRTICILILFLCMLGLKTASLYAVCPRQRIEKT